MEQIFHTIQWIFRKTAALISLNNNVFIVTLIFIIVSSSLCAQSVHNSGDSHTEDHHSEDHSSFKHHRVALFTGYALISGAIDEDGEKRPKIIPVLGLDYEYWVSHKIGLGVKTDIELASYSVQEDHQDYIKRNYAFVTALVFLYEPIPGWALFAGPGYEFETHDNFPLLKIGTDISKSFEGGWGVGLTVAYDIKEVNSAPSIGITVGKRLGK